jgi:glycosyltransferase involved in cell wall biosynthesis
MSRDIKIIFLGTQIEVAGAQRMILSQAKWFHEHGYKVEATFFYEKEKLLESWTNSYRYKITSLSGWDPTGSKLSNVFRLGQALVALFGELRSADVLIAYTPHSNLLGLPIAWLAGVPVRIGTHHGYIEGSGQLLARLHGWLTNSWICTTMVAVSKQVQDYILRVERGRQSKIVVIENGVEEAGLAGRGSDRIRVRNQLGVKEDEVMLLTVGRLTVQKGHTILLDAIKKIHGNYPNAKFFFAGEGPQRAKLEAQIATLGLEDKVSLLSVRDDVPNLLAAADVFVQPSLWEGLSLALLEAMFAKLPVLATQVEGTISVAQDEETALLAPPKDADRLASGLARLIEDAGLRRKLGQAGYARVKANYSHDVMCKSYEALILSQLDAN